MTPEQKRQQGNPNWGAPGHKGSSHRNHPRGDRTGISNDNFKKPSTSTEPVKTNPNAVNMNKVRQLTIPFRVIAPGAMMKRTAATKGRKRKSR